MHMPFYRWLPRRRFDDTSIIPKTEIYTPTSPRSSFFFLQHLIMLQLDNFFAWVTVDGCELTEYGLEYSQNLLGATCWIASEEQKVCQPQSTRLQTLTDVAFC